jgi:UDP-glucose 4-epimerase
MPSILTGDSAPQPPSNAYERSLRQLEADVRAFAEERPSVSVAILRLAPTLGDEGPLSRYLSLPIVPSILGFDPRLQLLSLADAARAFTWAIEQKIEGTLDIAVRGPLYLSRIVRLGGRSVRPLPEPFFRRLASGLGLPDHLVDLLKFGRVVDSPFRGAGCRDTVLDFYGTWKSSSLV